MQKIKLSKGLFAVVDDEDFERMNAFKWYASLESRGTKFYAIRRITVSGKRVKVRMHHAVLNMTSADLPEGHVCDHVNHDSLDNRKENLEIVTQTENMIRAKGWKRKVEEVCL